MDTSEFDAKMAKLEVDMKDLREEMEETCKELLAATSEFIIDWSKKDVENEVSNSENTIKLGVEGLRKLKSDLQDLISKIPDLVKQYLNKDNYWGHRGVFLAKLDYRPLEEGTRVILGYVGEIYQRYGYPKDTEIWQSQQEPNRLKYSGRIDFWTGKRSEILKRYHEQNDRLLKILNDLNKVKKERTQAEAKNLWDQV